MGSRARQGTMQRTSSKLHLWRCKYIFIVNPRDASMASAKHSLSSDEISRVIEMAWEDRTPFEAIEASFGLKESDVIELMRREMKLSSFKMWRERVSGRKTKHVQRRGFSFGRHVCPTQRTR